MKMSTTIISGDHKLKLYIKKKKKNTKISSCKIVCIRIIYKITIFEDKQMVYQLTMNYTPHQHGDVVDDIIELCWTW